MIHFPQQQNTNDPYRLASSRQADAGHPLCTYGIAVTLAGPYVPA